LTSCSSAVDSLTEQKHKSADENEVYEAIKQTFTAISEYNKNDIDKYFGGDFLLGEIKYPTDESSKLIAKRVDYQVYDITVNDTKDKAFAEIEITGVDMAKSYYEMEMFLNFMIMNDDINEDKAKELTTYIVNRNIDNIRSTSLNITLNKVNNEWVIAKDVNIQNTILGSSIPTDEIMNKVIDNYYDYIDNKTDLYTESSGLTLEEYLRECSNEFVDKYMENYINYYSFDKVF